VPKLHQTQLIELNRLSVTVLSESNREMLVRERFSASKFKQQLNSATPLHAIPFALRFSGKKGFST
jgi:hypothetical protein